MKNHDADHENGHAISNRRTFLGGALAAASAFGFADRLRGADAPDLMPLRSEIEKQHDQSVKRIQDWIKQPSIAAENRGMSEGCELQMELLRDAGFENVTKIPTDGFPGVFARLDAGAPRTVGIYFMYDVKQVDPSEWSSPPFEAALVDKAKLGKVIVGRGAVNTKGPQGTFLAALHAFKGAGRKLPVNLVFVAEGEEEIGSPHFPQVVHRPEVLAGMKKCQTGVYMPMAGQGVDGSVDINLGAKGVVELELVSSSERWGRGPKQDLHSSNEARVDSPAWHLVQALTTLVGPDGHTPAIPYFAEKARPLTPAEKAMIREAARRQPEAVVKQQLGVQHWVHDVDYLESLELLVSKPTINIEGLVSGYTGPGGKTILPHKAVAKIDMRLVPNLTAAGALAALKEHLAKHGFRDIEVNMTGGYDPTSTSADSALIRAEQAVYKRAGYDPILWPRLAGSWPGYVFTGDPLNLPAGHFGLGHGNGAHAPNEYYVIESANPKVKGLDDAVFSHVEYLYELARI
ncbi:MAG: M20/M25/M40 family metallo-hydrolase [Acidobacteriaceae bacterium]|nr:M20/M25/M40 family metallo-hydrolase [Acidobacteriaceae bacterium]